MDNISGSQKKFQCPCCGYFTLPESGEFDICPVCYWEDDPVQSRDIDFSGGANTVCLRDARENYTSCGAFDEKFIPFVREPSEEELQEYDTESI